MIFSKPSSKQALALAAIFQSCELVADLAHHGDTQYSAMALSMSSLLNQNPTSLQDLYGAEKNLSLGIRSMADFFSKKTSHVPSQRRPEVLRYVVSSLYLARKLSANQALLCAVSEGIKEASQRAAHFSVTHENVYSNIASLYQQTISSTLGLRIQVTGCADYLKQPAIATRIRCLLFAAIRSAFLWQQLGGKRTHIMFWRQALARQLPDC